MRILYHHRTLGDGAEGIHIAEMVNAFRQLGHEVLVIGPGVQNLNGAEKKSARYTWIKKILRGPLYEIAELTYNFFGYRNICKAIRGFHPDFIYDRYITFNYSAIAAGKKYNLPVFLEVNAPLAYEREHEPDERLYLKKLAYAIERKVCSDASKTIVVSTPLKEYLVSVGVPEEKIMVLPNGVNTEKFFPRPTSESLMKKYQITDDEIVIGFVGILRSWHGIDMLLEAFNLVIKEHGKCKLLLVGDGPIRHDIEHMALDLGIGEKVIITGRVSHDQIGEYVSLFDIAVSPKATFYASPMKILEYMAQGKAVVAPNMLNIKDIIAHKRNGLLFKANDMNDLVEKLGVFVNDRQLQKKLGENATETVHAKRNWVSNANYVIASYKASR